MTQNIAQIKLSVLVVLYKRHYEDSIAITTLLACVKSFQEKGIKVDVFVWNNTPQCSPSLVRENLTWLEGNNDGLPHIYNRVAAQAFEAGATHFVISDDDTDYSAPNYVGAIVSAVEFEAKSSPDVFGVMLPKIYSGEKLVSPGERFWFFGRLSTTVDSGMNTSLDKLAINSGVIFTKACYARMAPLFDERLKFYATDTAFFVRYESYYSHFYVLDTALQHDLSEHTSDSPERAVFRFQEMIRGFRVIFERKSYFFRGVMEGYLIISALRKSISYKDSGFFRSYISSFTEKK
ncbi:MULTISPECIES: hypothetical protein [unclassified Pseudomonas]|uniref:hypothetical protein n=1 Tax=unclassified Pseudomonas TaxID=196821 RepID=UPI000F56F29B|nr:MULTISPECIES: hypothetical protein [unclassified Pseudomonas]AZF46968.1 hypothetical protein C4J86_1719 [Pseudomonas sp. R2-7-07]AZF57517.1 hypothetical protein C4J84_1626 [Pseudomonas sp. R11-23-07]